MPQVKPSDKRMFYRLLNHLIQKQKNNSSEIPAECISIINRYQKKSPIKGIY